MHIQITQINTDKGELDTELADPKLKGIIYNEYTEKTEKTVAEVFRDSRAAFGRCISKVYVDRPNQPPLAQGWAFHKRLRYDDSDETYLCETWVSLFEDPEPRKPVDIERTVQQQARKEVGG